jgi:hypothetical protein
MKLYYHPVSTTSRPIMLLAAESGLELEYQALDRTRVIAATAPAGQHHVPP